MDLTDGTVKLPKGAIEGIVNAHIEAAVVEALNRDPEALVAGVVRTALTQKKNSYDRATIWDHKVNEMIREAAESAFKRWLDGHREKIDAAVAKALKKHDRKIATAMAEKTIARFVSGFTVNVNFHED